MYLDSHDLYHFLKIYDGRMLKIAISKPMQGTARNDSGTGMRTTEIYSKLTKVCPGPNFFNIDTYIAHDIPKFDNERKLPVWFLGRSIELLSNSDLLIFANDWEMSRGCSIEYIIAREYRIPYTYEKIIDKAIKEGGK